MLPSFYTDYINYVTDVSHSDDDMRRIDTFVSVRNLIEESSDDGHLLSILDDMAYSRFCSSIVTESIASDVGEFMRTAKDEKKLTDSFADKTRGIIGYLKKLLNKHSDLTENDYNKLKKLEDEMRAATEYGPYKKAFDAFCHMLKIKPTIIFKIKYSSTKDRYMVDVTYSDVDKEITIPNGSVITHVSPNEFNELKPQFKSKAAEGVATRGGYFYSTPRVYVTINPDMPNTMADLKTGAKVNKYIIPENIRTAKVDAAFNSYKIGACYIETKFPIKVTKVTKEQEDDALKKYEEKKARKKSALVGAAAGVAVGATAVTIKHKLDDKKKEDKDHKK